MSINRDIRDFGEKWLSVELLGISKDLGD